MIERIKILLIQRETDDHEFIEPLLTQSPGLRCDLHRLTHLVTDGDAVLHHDVCLLYDRASDAGDFGFIREWRMAGNEVPVIVLATEERYDRDLEWMRGGAAAYLVLSRTTPSDLERSIRYAIERTQRESESARRASAELLQFSTAIENLPVGVTVTDPNASDNPMVYANPAFSAITGYAIEEVLGRNMRFLAHPNSDPRVQADIRAALAECRPYRGAWPAARVRDHIAEGRGTHFEPRVAERFLDLDYEP